MSRRQPVDASAASSLASHTRSRAANGRPEATSSAAGAIVARMESMMEAVACALANGGELSLHFVSRKNMQRSEGNGQDQHVRFPGKCLADSQKFARVLLILQLSHDALVSGIVLTKRHIFYQHQELFERQRVVDELVDDLAATLSVQRDDLNIVATAKGLVFGPATIRLRDGAAIEASLGDTGTPIPVAKTVSTVECFSIRWVLVVEKDATFRSLLSSGFWRTSLCGQGLLVTAKGYPDLITRNFLGLLRAQRAEVPIMVLTDFDPDGLNIFRCYRLAVDVTHGPATCIPGMRWLGIKSGHVCHLAGRTELPPPPTQVQSQPGSRSRASPTSTHYQGLLFLTPRDRRHAKGTLRRVSGQDVDDEELLNLKRELQVMLMMGVKAEIQWLDDAGDLTEWLERTMCAMLS